MEILKRLKYRKLTGACWLFEAGQEMQPQDPDEILLFSSDFISPVPCLLRGLPPSPLSHSNIASLTPHPSAALADLLVG